MKNPAMRQRAQSLRKNATQEENKLWYQYLRTYPIQWKRQRVFSGYIVDFYCSKAKLVIELDGAQHFEQDAQEYDQVRTEFLSAMDLEVIRFSNADINQRFRDVCDAIDLAVKTRLR